MCNAEIVDKGDGAWCSIPRGFRVVWRPVAGARPVRSPSLDKRADRIVAPPAMARQEAAFVADIVGAADVIGGEDRRWTAGADRSNPMPPVQASDRWIGSPVQERPAETAVPAAPVMVAAPSFQAADGAKRGHSKSRTPKPSRSSAAKPGLLVSFWEKARSLWQPRSTLSEPASRSYRYLAQQLMVDFPKSARAPIVLASAACAPATAISTAMLLAAMLQDEAGGRLVIVDATLRDGGIGDALGHHGAPGLLDLLGGRQNDPLRLARETARPGVWVIPSGRIAPGSQHMPEAARITDIFNSLAGAYDHVIVVQHAIMTDTRYLPIAREASVTLMMVEEVESRMADIQRYIDAFTAHGIDDVRLVLCAHDASASADALAVKHAA